MPLHSRSTTSGTRSSILARRGSTQPYFVLDTTLFLTEEGAIKCPRAAPLLMTAAQKRARQALTQLRFSYSTTR